MVSGGLNSFVLSVNGRHNGQIQPLLATSQQCLRKGELDREVSGSWPVVRLTGDNPLKLPKGLDRDTSLHQRIGCFQNSLQQINITKVDLIGQCLKEPA